MQNMALTYTCTRRKYKSTSKDIILPELNKLYNNNNNVLSH